MKTLLPLLLLLAAPAWSKDNDPQTVLLWPGGAPGAQGSADVDKPSVSIYLPDPSKATGTAVVVCPGGGYSALANDHEGKQIARWLNSIGVAAFVLKYRLGPEYHHPIELHDAQRAVRYVRSHAREMAIAPDRIGIWGFSAGGHLASTAATHFDSGDANASDPIDRAGSRPDFAILCYPVVAMTGPYVHRGSHDNLLGASPDAALEQSLSNALQVTAQTPPTFLFHTTADPVVPVENSVEFYLALRRNHIPAEMHIFEEGPHGVGLAATDATLSIWPTLLSNWLRIRGLLER